jgi:6-pyruvoyltetrahydropterin/6-carboxytetrahydropterin synthase
VPMHLRVKEKFEAAHALCFEEAGECQKMHGHTYTVEVTVSGKVNKLGWVLNFKELRQMLRHVIKEFDHRTLNDVMESNPTAENLAQHIFDSLAVWVLRKSEEAQLVSVSLQEGEGGVAIVYE